MYLDKLKTLTVNGQLVKQMKAVNKLDLNSTKLSIIQDELVEYLSVEKLEEVRKGNRGVFQLLIWELYIFEFHKHFNPFDFISSEFIMNRFDKDEVDVIKYYCEVMNYLKYNLKIKYKFNKSFEFEFLIKEIKTFLTENKMNLEVLFDDSVENAKIANVYFETKDVKTYILNFR